MSNFSYDDFAVLVRSFSQTMLSSGDLRIVPLSTAPSMADAIKGIPTVALNTPDTNANLPKQKNGHVVDSNVTVQHDSAGYCRLVGHIEASAETAVKTAQAFVLYSLAKDGGTATVIAVASLKEGFAIGDVCYPSFTITTVNNYQSVAFNPNAFATVEDLKSINGLDGLHIAFDTASGDLKLLDKDGNVLDQANLPIKADVIIADGEEGYKYVKTDVEQDIHATKAWMPAGDTAWKTVPVAPYKMSHAALVVEKGSTPASRVFVSEKPIFGSPISTKSVPLEHVVIDGSTYMLDRRADTTCTLRKVKGGAEAPTVISAVILDGKVTHDGHQYDISNESVEVDVIEYEGVTYVLVGSEDPGKFIAQPISGESAGQYYGACPGIIVTSEGSSTASRVFVDPHSGSFPISTEPVPFEHVVIDGSTYMLVDRTETNCNLIKVKGKAEAQTEISAGISGGKVTHGDPSQSYDIANDAVEVDVIKDKEGVNTYVLVGTNNPDNPNEFRALSTGGSYRVQYSGTIVTLGGSSADKVLGIAVKGDMVNKMYAFDEAAPKIQNISGQPVSWFGTKDIPAGSTLKYGLEAFVWTVKGADAVSSDTFFGKLNESLLALGFHEGDDIALGTNLTELAKTGEDAPLYRVDADDYMHGEKTKNAEGKTNKELREQEVDAQRGFAKDELVAWNAQHPELKHNEVAGTRISDKGLDIRNGKILIGDGLGLGKDAVSHYELSTNFKSGVDSKDEGLALTVLDASDGSSPRNVLTISDSSYISGAPICMALMEVTESNGTLSIATKRRTACFECEMTEAGGTVTITITDKRLNSKGFATTVGARNDCIVEISPVYISSSSAPDSSSAPEMLPALNMVNTVATVGSTVENQSKNDKLTCTCPKIIDWANSVNISEQGQGNRLFVIVKVY